ncbi:hypothetical protein GINT2_001432 [Glugoides intestinalis]
MSLLYHPITLTLLSKFKKTGKKHLLEILLTLLIDNTIHLNIAFLRNILSEYACIPCKLLEEDKLEYIIKTNFISKKDANGSLLCLARCLETTKYAELIIKNRKGFPSALGNEDSGNFIVELEFQGENEGDWKVEELQNTENNIKERNIPKDCLNDQFNNTNVDDSGILDDNFIFKSAPDFESVKRQRARRSKQGVKQENTLSFEKVKLNASTTASKLFSPVAFKNAIFVYDPTRLHLDTLRKRDDLANPVNLQFIKHFDQARPPIYQKRGSLLKKKVFSFRKIPEVLSYEEDSSASWEAIDDSSITMEESSETETQEDEEWIERDSEDAELTRYNKKPHLLFQDVQIKTFFEPERFKNANLIFSADFSDELLIDLKKWKSKFQKEEELIKEFSHFYNVLPEVVSLKLSGESSLKNIKNKQNC